MNLSRSVLLSLVAVAATTGLVKSMSDESTSATAVAQENGDLQKMRQQLSELKDTLYDPRAKPILELEKRIAAAEAAMNAAKIDGTQRSESGTSRSKSNARNSIQQTQPRNAETESGAQAIPAGMRVCTILVDSLSSHQGIVQPGDRLDLLFTFRVQDPKSKQRKDRVLTLMEFIEVFAVDNLRSPGEAQSPSKTISILVSTDQASKLELAKQTGKLSTVLRNKEAIPEPTSEVTFTQLKEELYGANSARIDPEQFLQVYRLHTSNLQDIVKTLDALMPGCVVNEDSRLGRVHILASEADHKVLSEVIMKLDTPPRGKHKVVVLVAATAIQPGQKLSAANTRHVLMEQDVVPSGALMSPKQLLGRYSTVARAVGDFIRAEQLSDSPVVAPTTLGRKPGRSLSVQQRRELELDRSTTETLVRSAEGQAAQAAAHYRELSDAAADKTAVEEASTALREAVQATFDAKWNLQDIRLRQTSAELQELQEKHQRRKTFSERIIDRRVQELTNAGELSWSQPNTRLPTTKNVTATGSQPSATNDETAVRRVVDHSMLQGMWFGTLGGIGGEGLQPVTVTFDGDSMHFHPGGQVAKFTLFEGGEMRVTGFEPKMNLRGHYRFEADSLRIRVESIVAKLDLTLLRSPAGPKPDPASPVDKSVSETLGIPRFDTPDALLDHIAGFSNSESLGQFFDLLIAEEQQRFTGMLLYSVTMANTFQSNGAMTDNDQALADMASAGKRLDKYFHSSPPPIAASAYAKLSTLPFQVLSGQPPVQTPVEMSRLLRESAGVIKNPREFVTQVASSSGEFDTQGSMAETNWDLSVEGDTATAVDIDDPSQKLELVRMKQGWKISKMLGDEIMEQLVAPSSLTTGTSDFLAVNSTATPNRSAPQTLKSALHQAAFTELDLEKWVTPSGLSFRLIEPSPRSTFPDWIADYIRSVNDLLEPNSDWGEREFKLMRSLDAAIHFAKDSHDWDLGRSGDLARQFVTKNVESRQEEAFPLADSPWSAAMLSRVARTTGQLPDVVYKAEHSDPHVRKRLRLLDTMISNNADQRWIAQEQIRLSGLLLEAPVETIRLLVEKESGNSHLSLKHWLFALSKKNFYDVLKSNSNQAIGTPIDPVLLVVILEELVGESSDADDRIGYILQPTSQYDSIPLFAPGLHGNAANGEMPAIGADYLARHLYDILSSDFVYREAVFNSLVNIYRRSKSESLKQNLEQLSAAIRVHANEQEANDESDMREDAS